MRVWPAPQRFRSVRARTIAIVGGALLVLLVLHNLGLRYAFVRVVGELEHAQVEKAVDRTRSELHDEIEDLDGVTADYASWDKTYTFAVDRSAEFVESDLADEALRHLRLEAAAVVDTRGHLVLFRSLMPAAQQIQLQAALLPHLQPGRQLTLFPAAPEQRRGVLDVAGGALIVAARPILKSDGTGPARGTFLMARRLDEVVRALTDTVKLPLSLTLRAPSEHAGPASLQAIGVTTLSEDRIRGDFTIADVYGQPRWTLAMDADRSLHRQGERLFWYFVLALAGSVIAVASITLLLLNRLVLRRLATINRAVLAIAKTGNLSQRVRAPGRDELAAVGGAIDSMLESLEVGRRAVDDERRRTEAAALNVARLKSEFLANMSHEIRTPVNGVLGMLRILDDTSLTNEQHESVRTALSSTDTILAILNDVLDLSKLEAGKMSLTSEPVDLRLLVDDVLAMIAPGLGSKELDLLARTDAAVPRQMLADPLRLRQVLTNLVGNASKFTLRGHVLVDSRVEVTAEATTLVIDVVDTGVGIAPEKQASIFESFTQADASTTRRFGGSGLGLTIVRRLVGAMGGDVSVRSRVDSGSTFTCRLPCVGIEDEVEVPLRGRVRLIDVPGVRRNVYSAALRSLGLEVTEHGNARELATSAVDSLRPQEPVIALCTPEPPDCDGLEELSQRGARVVLIASAHRFVADLGTRVPGATAFSQPVSRAQWLRLLGGARESSTPSPAPQFSGRVLVAEDNPLNRRVAVSLLRKHGCLVETAETGLEAVKLSAESSFDLILMDCQMPELDGMAAAEQIRARSGARVPIVALTADVMSETREQCLAAGMNGYLAKPFSVSELRDVLSQYLPAA